MAKTVTGIRIAGGAPLSLDCEASAGDKGKAAVEALSLYREGVPHPKKWDSVSAPLYAAAGVKTLGGFVRGAKMLSLDQDHGFLKIFPSDNLGVRSGFQHRDADAIVLPFPYPLEGIGAAIERALEAST